VQSDYGRRKYSIEKEDLKAELKRVEVSDSDSSSELLLTPHT